MTGFSLQTLGFPEIHGDNRPIKLNLRKGLALLIYLAAAQGAVARDVTATCRSPRLPASPLARDCVACFIASSLRSAEYFRD